MPRDLSAEQAPILLKHLLKKADVSSREFGEIVLRETGVNISKTSIRYLLDNGSLLKRVKNFKAIITQVILKNFSDTLEEMDIEPDEIWTHYQETEDDTTGFIEQIKKFMEVTMITRETMTHFGLKSNPFTLDIRKESDIFLSTSHLYALEVMREAAEYGGFAVITGQVGSGKSTIFSKFLEETRINNKYQIIFPEAIDKTRLNAKQILQACIYDLSESVPKGSMEALSRQVKELLIKRNDEQLSWQVEKLLRERAKNNEKTVLIIDEAHRLHTQTLKALKNLLELEDGFTSLIAIILIGQEELEERLYGRGNMEVREVAGRINHIKLNPINNELESFLKAKFDAVKLDIKKVITPEAIKLLSEKWVNKDKNGIREDNAYPLEIGNNIKRMMNYCAYAGEEIITPDVIKMIGV